MFLWIYPDDPRFIYGISMESMMFDPSVVARALFHLFHQHGRGFVGLLVQRIDLAKAMEGDRFSWELPERSKPSTLPLMLVDDSVFFGAM